MGDGFEENVVNNIQGSLPDLGSDVNDLKYATDQKTFGVISLNNVVNNLNITDLQRKINKVEATVKASNKNMP